MNVLLTGATGAVGNGILRYAPPHFRFAVIGRDISRINPSYRPKISVFLSGDVRKKNAGLGESDLQKLQSMSIQKVFHAAGSVNFDDRAREETWAVNVQGTRHLLSLSRALDIPEFHHISTAYAPLERNPYERSKLAAEKWVIESGLPHSIYRLGIVVGDTRHCHMDRYNGLYGFFSIFESLKKIYSGHREGEVRNEWISLPLKVTCSPTSTLNLVPIDWLCETFFSLIDLGVSGQTFHLTHPHPPKVVDVMTAGFEFLKIKDIILKDPLNRETSPREKNSDPKLLRLQISLDFSIGRFQPYTIEEPVFDLTSTAVRLGTDYHPPNSIKTSFIEGLLDAALKKQFGRISTTPKTGSLRSGL